MSNDVEFCQDCGWSHANVQQCWRKTRREVQEALADPTLNLRIRAELQAALDIFEAYSRDYPDELALPLLTTRPGGRV